MKKPAFLFYTGDWLKDPGVRRLSPREKGVYIELLILMFDSGGYVQMPEIDLMHALNFRLEIGEETKSSVDTFHTVLERLIECNVIHKTEDGKLFNSRILRDLEIKDELSQKRSEAGKLGNQKRWNRNCDNLRSQSDEVCDKEKIANDRFTITSSITSSNNNSHTNARPREDEPLPRNMPDSETKAIEMCLGTGVPDDFIRQAFQDAYAVGFRDRGNPIINWKAYISAYWMRYQNAQKRKESQKQAQSKPQARVEEPREVIHLKRLN